jgi:TolB protein
MRRSHLLLGLLSAFCSHVPPNEALQPTIAFVSTRDDPAGDFFAAPEIYLMNADGTDARRITRNSAADFFPSISPDGRQIVFETNRLRAAGEPQNVSDIFLMNIDGTQQRHVIRGSSATWSPNGKKIAFHASASGKGQPIVPFPGAATTDSDIFVMDLGGIPRNMTNNPDAIDDDPDWSPDGRKILFTSHVITDKPTIATSAEIYVMNADGSGMPVALTHNQEEERAPSWSPDGKRIVFCCRRGAPTFEICVMNADGTGEVQLTHNNVADLTPSWSPDGKKIAWHRTMGGRASFQIWTMNADGSDPKQITDIPGANAFPRWGKMRLTVDR